MTDPVDDVAIDLGQISRATASLIGKAVRKTAFDIQRDAKQAAPVDTGNLKASIGIDFNTNVGQAANTEHGGTLSADIGPTAEYGGYVEFGTSRHAPQPYLLPAYERNIDAFEDAVERIIDQATQ